MGFPPRTYACFVLVLGILLTFSCNLALGEDAVVDQAVDARIGLQPLDWVLVALYAISTIGLGVYFGSKQKSTSEYFVGGGDINPVLIGVSLFATLLSTISYLSHPGEAAGKGPVIMASLLGYPLVYVIIAYGLLPLYMRQRVTSAYELLEENLGLSTRLLGAVMFLALRLVWMTLLVYLAAKAMTIMMGVQNTKFVVLGFETGAIPLIVLATGIVSVIYTTLGGLRAVVVTDLMQTILLFGGALLVVITVSWSLGGFGWFPREWHPNWDTQPIISFDPKTRITVAGSIMSMLCWYICTAGGDQTVVQRYMATTDLRAARRAVAVQLTVGVAVGITLTLVGFALLRYFEVYSADLPAGLDLKKNADDLFPRYIAYHLPIGISGLVVAAMFAAAMSSIDSGVNSVTAVVMTDFLDRFGLQPKTEKGHIRVARALALTVGLTVVLGSTFMGYIPGNITAITNKTVNLLTAPIFALFFFALFVPRISAVSAWIGTWLGVFTAAMIAFSGPLVYWLHVAWKVDPATFNVEIIERINPATGTEFYTCEDPISFQWIGPVSLLASVLSGWLLSFVFPRRKARE